jgi:hypothetical protein
MKGNIVGIISDTHDNRAAIEKAVTFFNQREAGLVVHAGDFVAPFTVLDFKKLACPLEMVFGNNDGERVGLSAAFQDCGILLPGPRTFVYQGKTFLLMHEQGCLDQLAAAAAVDVIIYGHTHDVDIRTGPPLIINPGEAGGWLRGRATAAILDLDRMAVELVDL